MSVYKNVLLLGASGRVGSAIQTALLENKSSFSKLGVATSAASYGKPEKQAVWTVLKDQGVEVIALDLTDKAAMVEAFKGWDVIISALGMPMVKLQIPIIDAAAVAGVKRFLPSEYGFDLTIPSNRSEKVYAMKIAVADYLEKTAKAYPSFSYTLLAIGGFAEFTFMVPAMFDLDLPKRKANIIGDGKAPISFTSYADCASFVIGVLLNPEETKNVTIRVEGEVATWNDMIRLLEKAQGKPYTVTYESTVEAQAKEVKARADGDPGAARFALRRVMAQGNAKLPVVENRLFPKVKVTTNLEAIVIEALKSKGIPIVVS